MAIQDIGNLKESNHMTVPVLYGKIWLKTSREAENFQTVQSRAPPDSSKSQSLKLLRKLKT